MFMRYGLMFLVLALGSLAAGYQFEMRWVQVLFACFALAFLVVAAAYLGLGPRVFLKSSRGRLHPASWLWLWPFYLLNGLLFNAYHRLYRRAAYTEIIPGLYLGRRLGAGEARALGACGVLDLTCELGENRVMRNGGRYLCLPVLDNTCPTMEQLVRGVNWLEEALRAGPVYVHCAAGHGRSATLVVAYLLATGQVCSIDEGVRFLKAKRPGVHVNGCQRTTLLEFVRTRLRADSGQAE